MLKIRDIDHKDFGIYPYTFRSLFFHVGLLVIFVLFGTVTNIFSHSHRSKISFNIVQSSVRVDVVAMPQLTINELKHIDVNMTDTSTVEEETVEEVLEDLNTEDTEFLKQKKKKSFLSLMQQLGNKKIPNANKAKDKVKKKSSDKGLKLSKKERIELQNLVLAGNKISKGVAATGDVSEADTQQLDSYIEGLPEIVRPYWKLPSYLLGKDLNCRIRIFLSPDGSLLNALIFESSGEVEYDNRALEAVKKAAPFPPMDKAIVKKGINGEILLGFPL